MKKYSWNKWTRRLAGVAGLALVFNLSACQIVKPYTAPLLPKNTTEENLKDALDAVTGYKPADCRTSSSSFANATPVLKRSLTKDEHAFYTRFYQGELNLGNACIHLHEGRIIPGLASTVAEGEENVISVFGAENYSQDYTKEKNPGISGILASGTMHLLQHQKKSHENQPESYKLPVYETLDESARLDGYGEGRKRALVDEYVRFVFHPASNTAQSFEGAPCAKQDLLIRTIEDKFPGAKELRQVFERRTMTDDEKALELGIFGDQIASVDRMTVVHHAQCDIVDNRKASVDEGSKTEFHSWGHSMREADYTRGNLYNFGIHVHEITHEWQSHQEYRHTASFTKDYLYKIDAKNLRFKDYHFEQQSSIVEDYARYFLHKDKTTLLLEQTPENLEDLRKTVEDQFPMAARTRLYFEKHGKLPDLATVRGWVTPTRPMIQPPPPRQ